MKQNPRTTMQQGCCDMFGIGVEKSMVMRMGSDMMEPMELLHHSSSNEHSSPPPLEIQTCSGDEDGNSSEHHHRSPPTSCENSTMDEPKTAKKRRKQSNPLRYQNAPVMPLLESEQGGHPALEEPSCDALDLQHKPGAKSPTPLMLRCHHCSDTFESEDALRVHVEEEHVQKVLERQLQQQSYNKTTSGEKGNNSPKTNSELALQQQQHLLPAADHTRNSPSDGLLTDHREYKSPHFPFPPMPPFIPFSRSDDSKPMPVPPSMFPNPMMPFLFPVMPQGQTPPASNGNSHSGQGVRIFNLEAYCELCNKEFCNKYFLKTHKANKHGIYSVDSIASAPYPGPFLSPSLSSPLPLPNPIMLPTTTAEPSLPQRAGLINMESYCEICQKEFCNKYFLKKHRQKIHGIVEPGQTTSPCTTPLDTTSSSPIMTTAVLSHTSAPSFPDTKTNSSTGEENLKDAASNSKLEFSSIFSMHNHTKPSAAPAISSTGVVPNTSSSSSCPPPPMTTTTTSGAMVMGLLSPGQTSTTIAGGDSSVSHVFTPEKLREMGVINADAFCELCCKEFCNKYFLRTHKLNKHGINMPEISPGRGSSGQQSSSSSHNQNSQSNDKNDLNPLVDEGRIPEGFLREASLGLNFDGGLSGELSCDYCNRPFSSLYLLKMHKFYTHNVPYIKEESKSKPNSPTGDGNNQENKENEFLKPHLPLSMPPTSLFSENSPTSLQEDAASQDLQKLQSMIRELNASAGSESSKIVCNLCKLEFDNKYFLRAHMMNEHGVLPNEDGHVPGHGPEFNGLPKNPSSENGPDVQRLNINNASPTVDSEAYCELCQKEFCSKYFLKTHKQNIHGLPVDMSSSTPRKTLAEEVSQIKTIVNNTLSTSLASLVSSSPSVPSSGVLTSCFTSATQPLVPLLSPFSSVNSHFPIITSSYSPTVSQSLRSSPAVSSPANQPSSTTVPSMVSSTTITPTPSRAISHMNSSSTNHTPIFPSNLSISKMTSMANMNHPMSIASMATSSINNSTSLSSIAQIAAHTAHLPSMHPTSTPLAPLEKPRSNLTGRNYCNICNKELCNKYFMKTHMLKMHGINLDSQPHEAARISTIGGVQCDICQKELCSKYFLKVHKQNTHGIFEEGSQGKDMREHPPFLEKEQPLQGLDLSDPSGRYFSHYPEICPVCNCRFKSIKWLKAHMISDHGNILKENFPLNTLPSPPENNNLLDENCCLCVLCGQGFADKVALHVHLIKDHQSASDEVVAANSNSGIIKASTAPDSSASAMALVPVNGSASPTGGNNHPRPPHHPKPHGGSRTYHCSFCVYSTRWLSNLYAHEKRHTGVITEGEKKFVCRVCHRAYRYNHSLQRHFLSHRAAGLNVKDLAQPLIVTSQMSSSLRPWNFHKKHAQGKGKMKRYRCSKCSKKFRSRELCLAHIHSTHKRGSMLQKSVKPFRCRFCGFQTRVWNVLRIHINRQHHSEILDSKQQRFSADNKSLHSELSNEPPTITSPPEVPSPKMSVAVADGFPPGLPPPPPNSPHLPMTFAMPQNPPTAGSFIMQPFLLAQPDCDGVTRNGTFVPSLVYLPVCQKVAQPMTVAFTLTPA